MSKLNLIFLIISAFLVNICVTAPDYNNFGGSGHAPGYGASYGGSSYGSYGHGGGFADCRTEANYRLIKCLDDYGEDDYFMKKLNFYGRPSKDTCCKFYYIRRCLRRSLLEIENCRDTVDHVVGGKLSVSVCEGYIESDCGLPIWAIILIVIFSILFLGCLIAGIVYLLRKRQTN